MTSQVVDHGVSSMTILVVPDTQVKPEVDISHIAALGELVVNEQPETIVIIGDWWDFPSLSHWDKGKIGIEGRRLIDDINAGFYALDTFLNPLRKLQKRQRTNKKKVYKPRIVFTAGNHEYRLERYMADNPNMWGMFDIINGIEERGIEYNKFLKVVEIDGILFSHFFANPLSGRPYGGTMQNVLQKVGKSFVQGHVQKLGFEEKYLPDGSHCFGVVAGAFYTHYEDYKGEQGNPHFRGFVKLHPTADRHDVEFVSISRLMDEYGTTDLPIAV